MKACATVSLCHVIMVACLWSPAPPASALIERLEIKDPRQFGYWIGDVMTREVTVDVAPPYSLERRSLPRPARLDRWLWLRDVEVESEGAGALTTYRLTFSYQFLTAPPQPQRLFIPQQTIYFSDGAERVPVFLQSLGVHVSPLLATAAAAEAGFPDLHAAVPPPPLDTHGHLIGLAAAGVGMLLATGVLLYVYGILPWLQRNRGPFHRALATLRPLARAPPTEEAVARALRSLHHAFNATAGEVLLAHDLPRFFNRFPGFKAHRTRIEEFYRGSRRWFFGPPRPTSVPPAQLRELLDLCRDCRDVERGLA